MKQEPKASYTMEELREIVHALRSEGGCPWDRSMTYDSLKAYLTEESGEVLKAVDKKDMKNLCEELGDVLLQLLLYSEIGAEDGHFTFDDVITGLARKLVRRHPHVFGDAKAETVEEALALWYEVKKKEKAGEIEI